MNGAEIVTLIQTVGFPIAAYLLLYFDLRSRIFSELEDMKGRIKNIEEIISGR